MVPGMPLGPDWMGVGNAMLLGKGGMEMPEGKPEGSENEPEGKENDPEGKENDPEGKENDPEGKENDPEGNGPGVKVLSRPPGRVGVGSEEDESLSSRTMLMGLALTGIDVCHQKKSERERERERCYLEGHP